MKPKKYIGLEMKMAQLGETNLSLSIALGINKNSLYNKKTGSTEFTVKDVRAIKRKLNLSAEELDQIFFN